jgi:hypothetical protein
MPSEDAIESFWDTVDRAYGAYLDAHMGFHLVANTLTDLQKQFAPQLNLTPEQLDKLPFTFGHGAPDDPKSQRLHEVSQGEVKDRNRQHGENSLFMGSLCLVAIYQFWEDHFRNEVAAELKVDRGDLKHDLLGDIRLIRNTIVHHGGVAKADIAKCRLLKWFKPGDSVAIDEEKMKQIVFAIRGACEEWKKAREVVGDQPEIAVR